MPEYVTLMGAEEVSRAASQIRDAAEKMKSAASELENTFFTQRQWQDEWLSRFEQVLAEYTK